MVHVAASRLLGPTQRPFRARTPVIGLGCVLLAILLLAAGCAGTEPPELPLGHPARADAPEAPPPTPSDTLAITAPVAVETLPAMQHGMGDMGGMEGMGGMDHSGHEMAPAGPADQPGPSGESDSMQMDSDHGAMDMAPGDDSETMDMDHGGHDMVMPSQPGGGS